MSSPRQFLREFLPSSRVTAKKPRRADAADRENRDSRFVRVHFIAADSSCSDGLLSARPIRDARFSVRHMRNELREIYEM